MDAATAYRLKKLEDRLAAVEGLVVPATPVLKIPIPNPPTGQVLNDSLRWAAAPAGEGSVGPQGEQGPAGAAGANGAQGDPGVGVPTGGTTAQLLAKIDGANYNTEWVDPPSGVSGLTSPQTLVRTLGS